MFNFPAAALCAAILLAGCTTGAPRTAPALAISAVPERAAIAREAVNTAMAADHIPAMSVAVSRNGELLWSEAFGTANLETGAAATRDTKFRMGSVSKLLAADLAVLLAEEGAVDLDADIRSYLPAFPDKGAPITLRQLLGHLGGVRHYAGKDYDFSAPGGAIDVRPYRDAASILAIFADDPLTAAPGEKYSYSTFGYSLIGLVLEAAARKPFPALVEEKLLRPAGISDIAVDDMFMLVENRAEFYDSIEDYEGLLDPGAYGSVVNAFFLNSAYKIPAGGYVGDAEAVAKFGDLHLAPGFFSESIYEDMFRIQTTSAGEETGVGLGWRVGVDDAGRRILHHSGSQQGGRAHLAVYPDEGVSIAILSNMGGRPRDIRALSDKIAAAFLGRKDVAVQPSASGEN